MHTQPAVQHAHTGDDQPDTPTQTPSHRAETASVESVKPTPPVHDQRPLISREEAIKLAMARTG